MLKPAPIAIRAPGRANDKRACTGPWTQGEVEYLRENHDRLTVRELADNINRRFNRKRSPGAVKHKMFDLKLPRAYSARENRTWENEKYLAEQRAMREAIPDTVHMDPRAASIWHLIDLKRAGHRQGHGELNIVPGEGLKRFISANSNSYLGSPADACASA
jgi:hypothetical protein